MARNVSVAFELLTFITDTDPLSVCGQLGSYWSDTLEFLHEHSPEGSFLCRRLFQCKCPVDPVVPVDLEDQEDL